MPAILWLNFAKFILPAILSFGAGWLIHSWKIDSETLSKQQDEISQSDTRAQNHEEFKEKERIKYVKVFTEVEKIVEKPFYINGQCLDDDGLRILNQAISGETPSEPASGVPSVTAGDGFIKQDNVKMESNGSQNVR